MKGRLLREVATEEVRYCLTWVDDEDPPVRGVGYEPALREQSQEVFKKRVRESTAHVSIGIQRQQRRLPNVVIERIRIESRVNAPFYARISAT